MSNSVVSETHNLSNSWKVVRTMDNDTGNECMVFTNGKEAITLLNDSVKTLRHFFHNELS